MDNLGVSFRVNFGEDAAEDTSVGTPKVLNSNSIRGMTHRSLFIIKKLLKVIKFKPS
jgi:hypothetical protein